MKRVLKILSLLVFISVLSGCTNKYEKLTYTTFNEYFTNKTGYTIIDKSYEYDIETVRYLEAGNGYVEVYYIEFQTDDQAIDYIKSSYEDKKGYKLKLKNDYSYVKSTNGIYFKLYRVDNVIINTIIRDKKYKKDINSVLKDLGY